MIAVVGDVLVDVVVAHDGPVASGSDTPAAITWRRGGAAANTAAWLAHLGRPVRLVGRIGADPVGRALADALGGLGVDLRLAVDPVAPTGTVVALAHREERDMYTSRGAAGALAPADLVDGWLDGGAHLHLSGYVLLATGTRAAGLAALAAAAAAGVAISVDPASAQPLAEAGAEQVLSWLPPGTLLTPNAAEATVLTGIADPAAAAQALAGLLGEAVVTLGAAGAVWSDGEAVVRASVQAVPGGDPVGAGDAFTAGLLAARMQGLDVEGQLHHACSVAGRLVRGERPEAALHRQAGVRPHDG